MSEVGPAAEEAWGLLRAHAEWADAAWFGWVFTVGLGEVEELRRRVDALPDGRATSATVRFGDVDEALGRLFSPECTNRRAVWVVGDGTDSEPWERLHLRLNERRERLRRHLAGGLLFVGRPDWKEPTRRAAPDLWSQRTVVLEWAPAPRGRAAGEGALDLALPEHLVPDADLALRGLRRAEARGDPDAQAVARVRLSQAALARGAAAEARDEALEGLRVASAASVRATAYAALAEAEEALDDLVGVEAHFAAALREVGEVASDEAAWWALRRARALFSLGKLDAASSGAAEAARRARSPRTQAAAMVEIGDVALAEGDLAGARAAFAESLDLCRRLRVIRGDLPEVLRDLSVVAAGLHAVAPDAALAAEARAAADALMERWPSPDSERVRTLVYEATTP